MEDIQSYLENWNGKDIPYLKEAYPRIINQNDFLKQLAAWYPNKPTIQQAATWLIKHHLEQKIALDRRETQLILSLFPLTVDDQNWQAQLHLLQILPLLEITSADLETLLPFIDRWCHSPNKFVRAWAYNGLAVAANHIPELLPEVKERFLLALEEEAASVKARVRNALAQLP